MAVVDGLDGIPHSIIVVLVVPHTRTSQVRAGQATR